MSVGKMSTRIVFQLDSKCHIHIPKGKRDDGNNKEHIKTFNDYYPKVDDKTVMIECLNSQDMIHVK